MNRYDYLIIGGGMTAAAAATAIRERDPKGTIGILSAESDPPYNRPPLTKALWKGDPLDSIWRRTEQAGASLHLGDRATALDRKAKRVTSQRGETLVYGKLLLATGGTPRMLPGSPGGVIYYRTLADYREARQLADRGATFVVIGGGFIGAEIAAALRINSRTVTMIVPENGISARMFPADLSKFVTDYYREKGATVHTGDLVESIESKGAGYVARTRSGTRVTGDAVIAGLGIVPNTDLARAAGLDVDDGILVDPQLHTSDPDIFAAGDVARFQSPLGKRMRVEHEDNANTMGTVAGHNMAGATERYDHLPFFYSDLFDLGYEAVGELDSRLETFADWKEPFREGVVYYLAEGRVRGVLLWNTWGQVDNARALIAEPGPFTPAQLRGRLPR